MKMKVAKRIALSLTGIAVLAGCAALGASRFDVSAYAKASFAEKGSARLDRLEQSDLQRTCSEYALKPLPDQVRARLEKQELERIRYPADGRYLGDWKQGEAIAQSGRGLQ
ncbi:MAG: sulfur oxidation c-type cytochrome SoxX, partial [Burkholderiaceae bacterium]